MSGAPWAAADHGEPSGIELAARAAAAKTASQTAMKTDSQTEDVETSAATIKAPAVALAGVGAAPGTGAVWAPSRIQIQAPPPESPPVTDDAEQPATHRQRSWPSSRGGLVRLRIGEHVCSRDDLELLGAAATAGDLHLGVDQNGYRFGSTIFQDGGSRITLVGGYWIAHLLAWRALAAGARIVVITRNAARWEEFVARAPGSANRVRVVSAERQADSATSLRGTVLLVDDDGALDPQLHPPSQAAVLTIVPALTSATALVLQGSSLVALQSQEQYEAEVAGWILGLNADSTEGLQRLGPDMLAIFGEGIGSYVWTSPSDAEIGQFGPPSR